LATGGFSPLSDICDVVVMSGGEYYWLVALFGFEDFLPSNEMEMTFASSVNTAVRGARVK
jgi:hypothetical protein